MLCLHQQLIKCFTARRRSTSLLFKNKHLHVLIILLCLQVTKKLQKCVPCSQVCNQNNNFHFFKLTQLRSGVILLNRWFLDIYILCYTFPRMISWIICLSSIQCTRITCINHLRAGNIKSLIDISPNSF